MGGATGRTGDTSMASMLTAVLWTMADPSTGADPYDSHDKALSSPWDEGNTLNRAGAEDTTARSASGGGRFFGCCPPRSPNVAAYPSPKPRRASRCRLAARPGKACAQRAAWGVRADPRRGHQRAQGGRRWADAGGWDCVKIGSPSKVFPCVADVKQRTKDGSSLHRGARNADSHTAYGYGDQ
jgi:hypothetical protein